MSQKATADNPARLNIDYGSSQPSGLRFTYTGPPRWSTLRAWSLAAANGYVPEKNEFLRALLVGEVAGGRVASKRWNHEQRQ